MSYEGWSQERIERHRAIVREQSRKRRKCLSKAQKAEAQAKKHAQRLANGYYERRKQQMRDTARAFKIECVAYKGGKCMRCGLIEDACVYDFHHRDPSVKDFGFAKLPYHQMKMTDKVRAELDKCDLLCANCHRLTHFHRS